MPRDQNIVFEDLAPVSADLTNEKSDPLDTHALTNMVLLVQTQDAGTAPVSPVIDVLVEESFDQVNWVAVSGWAIAQITSAGTVHAKDPEPERVGRYLRTSTTTTYGTANGRTQVRVWLSGESRI